MFEALEATSSDNGEGQVSLFYDEDSLASSLQKAEFLFA